MKPCMQSGRPKRKDNPKKLTIYVSAKARRLVDKLAFDSGQSISQYITKLIESKEVK